MTIVEMTIVLEAMENLRQEFKMRILKGTVMDGHGFDDAVKTGIGFSSHLGSHLPWQTL